MSESYASASAVPGTSGFPAAGRTATVCESLLAITVPNRPPAASAGIWFHAAVLKTRSTMSGSLTTVESARTKRKASSRSRPAVVVVTLSPIW